jgi:hypothetical protein
VADFEFPDDERVESDAGAEKVESARDAVGAALRYATDSRRPLTAGRRVMVLAWLVGALPGVRTQRELAALLECTPAATCKLTRQARVYLRTGGRTPRES